MNEHLLSMTKEQYSAAPFIMRYLLLRELDVTKKTIKHPAEWEIYKKFLNYEKELHSSNCWYALQRGINDDCVCENRQ